jgi:hypothetical protein
MKTTSRDEGRDAFRTPEWIRLPKPRERCPYCSLSRTSLSELVVPSPANDFRPPVKSIVKKWPRATRGIRLINLRSLLDYLNSMEGGQ